MDIIHKKVTDLTPTEYRACDNANYGHAGWMQGELRRCRTKGFPGQVIMLWNGPADKVQSLIGWALLTPVRTRGTIAGTRWTMKRSKFTVQFWVKKRHRRKGHATTLMSEVKKLDPRPHVFPHDIVSGELFSSYEVTIMRLDEGWINRRKPKIA